MVNGSYGEDVDFIVREHSGITPEICERPFFLKHLAAYKFAKDIVRGRKVLEIGFGSGYGSYYLSQFASEVVAVDLFEKNVSAAKAKWKESNLTFQTMDACDLKFEEKSFNVVIAFQLIEHIPRELYPVFFKNVKKVLGDEGEFVLSTPNLENLKKKGVKYEKNTHHDLEFTPVQFREMLAAEFVNVEMFGVNYSVRQKIFMLLKKSGIFKHFPNAINPVRWYFDNMPEKDFVVKKDVYSQVPDILAIVSG